jgi:hypothetical protein
VIACNQKSNQKAGQRTRTSRDLLRRHRADHLVLRFMCRLDKMLPNRSFRTIHLVDHALDRGNDGHPIQIIPGKKIHGCRIESFGITCDVGLDRRQHRREVRRQLCLFEFRDVDGRDVRLESRYSSRVMRGQQPPVRGPHEKNFRLEQSRLNSERCSCRGLDEIRHFCRQLVAVSEQYIAPCQHPFQSVIKGHAPGIQREYLLDGISVKRPPLLRSCRGGRLLKKLLHPCQPFIGFHHRRSMLVEGILQHAAAGRLQFNRNLADAYRVFGLNLHGIDLGVDRPQLPHGEAGKRATPQDKDAKAAVKAAADTEAKN